MGAAPGVGAPAGPAAAGHDGRWHVVDRVTPGREGVGVSDVAVGGTGRFVAFVAGAALVAADRNEQTDVYVRDRNTGDLDLVSVSSAGRTGNAPASSPALSDNGRFVAWVSSASDIVAGDTADTLDVFVHDRVTDRTERVSDGAGGRQRGGNFLPAISGDGRFVAFHSFRGDDEDGFDTVLDVVVHDRDDASSVRIPGLGIRGTRADVGLDISDDGRFLAFASEGALVPGDTNGVLDVFVRNVATGATLRASVGATGDQGALPSNRPSLNSDGSVVAFASRATNLVAGDRNNRRDIFVKNLATGRVSRASVASDGSEANERSTGPSLSADGARVAFQSPATNLVRGDTNAKRDVFVHDVASGDTVRASVARDGTQGNRPSRAPALAADGQSVAFLSLAETLVDGDSGRSPDAFVAKAP